MRNIIIALALAVISYSGAEAQTNSSEKNCKCASIAKKVNHSHHKYVHHHGSGDTYQVCVEKDGHYQCCMHHKTVTNATK